MKINKKDQSIIIWQVIISLSCYFGPDSRIMFGWDAVIIQTVAEIIQFFLGLIVCRFKLLQVFLELLHSDLKRHFRLLYFPDLFANFIMSIDKGVEFLPWYSENRAISTFWQHSTNKCSKCKWLSISSLKKLRGYSTCLLYQLEDQ